MRYAILALGLLVTTAQAAEKYSKEDCEYIETLFNNCTFDNTLAAWYREHPTPAPEPGELECNPFQPKDCVVENTDECGIQQRHLNRHYWYFTDTQPFDHPKGRPGPGVHPKFDIYSVCAQLCAKKITVAKALAKYCPGYRPKP
jgi:hypothetical protein